MTLTIKKIDAANPKDKPYKLADAGGLYLFVSVAGGKSWRSNYSVSGKQATQTYGRYPELSLARARRVHSEFKSGAQSKCSPAFEDVAVDWLKIKLPKLSNVKHQGQVEQTL
ncbi:MAG: DUF4102 domain-containing protein, partial [Ottowia sp.]|nr:DUF4102 domain-containing protein [Ottowia sp.]